MSILLNKHNLAVSEFAATEESRYSLRAILVTEKETVATDGHRLVRVSVPHGDNQKPENFPVVPGFRNGAAWKNFLLPLDAVKQIIKGLPGKKNKIPVLNHALIGHFEEPTGEADKTDIKPNIAVTDLDNPQVFTPRPLEGQFPNWDCVIPKQAPTFEIYVDANYLAQLGHSAAKFTAEDTTQCVRLRFFDANSPVRMDARNVSTGQAWTAVLMPMRGSKESVTTADSIPGAEKARGAARVAEINTAIAKLREERTKLQAEIEAEKATASCVPYPDAATSAPDAWRNGN